MSSSASATESSGRERHRLDDHPRLRALDLVDLGYLIRDREIAVDDPHAARPRERDGETRFGDRVHRRRDERDVQRDRGRQPRDRRDVVRQHVRLRREQEHVVEGEPLLAELPLERDEALDLLLAELGLHQTTLAASADGDQATSMPSSSRRSRARAAPATSPFASKNAERRHSRPRRSGRVAGERQRFGCIERGPRPSEVEVRVLGTASTASPSSTSASS